MEDEWNDMEHDFQNNTYNDPDDVDSGGVHLAQDRLYVRHIPADLTPQGLERAFTKFGVVVVSFISPDPNKRYGLVTMETPADAQNAMTHLNGTPPLHLSVTLAKKSASRGRRDTRRQPRAQDPPPPRAARAPPAEPPRRAAASSCGSLRERNVSACNDEYVMGDEEYDYEEYAEYDEEVDMELALKQHILYTHDLQRRLDMTRLTRLARQVSPKQSGFSADRYITPGNKVIVNNLPAIAYRAEDAVGTRMRFNPEALRTNVVRHRPYSGAKFDAAVDLANQEPIDGDTPPPLSETCIRPCVVCALPSLKFCGRCNVTPYCSAGCQQGDWGVRHRKVCHNLANHKEAATGDGEQERASRSRARAGDEVEGPPNAEPAPPVRTNRTNGVDTTDDRRAAQWSAGRAATPGSKQDDSRRLENRQSGGPKPVKRQSGSNDGADRPGYRGADAGPRDSPRGSCGKESLRNHNRDTGERRRPPLRHEVARQEATESSAPRDRIPEPKVAQRADPGPPKVQEANPETAGGVREAPAPVPMASKEKDVPEHYIPELVAVGGSMSLSVGGREAGAMLCVALDEAHGEQYDLLCGPLGERCKADEAAVQPLAGEPFCALDPADGCWYRARCLRGGALGEAALLDAARVLPLAGVACRRTPPEFRDIPEFSCLLTTDVPLKDGDVLMCTVRARRGGGVEAALVSAEGAPLGGGELARWRPPVHAPEASVAPTAVATKTPEGAEEVERVRVSGKAEPAAVKKAPSAAKHIPESFVAGEAAAGAHLILSVIELGGATLCLAYGAARVADFERLCGEMGAACEAITAPFVPLPGDLFCAQDPADGGWYRARCLRGGARGEAALLDAARVLPLAGVACRRTPPEFRDVPEFACVMETDVTVKEGDSFSCTVLSSEGGTVAVALAPTSGGAALGEARLARWLPPVESAAPRSEEAPQAPVVPEQAKEGVKADVASPKTERAPAAAAPKSSPSNGPANPAGAGEVNALLARPPLVGGSEVLLMEATSLERVFVRPALISARVEFDKTLQEAVMFGKKAPPLASPQPVGTFVLAEFVDGMHYRAVIKRTKHGQNKYLLEYVDFGNEQVTTLEKLRACPGALVPPARPVLTSQIRLHEVTALSEVALAYLNTLKDEEKTLVLTLPGERTEAPSGAAAMLTCAETRQQINARLQRMSTPEWKKMEEKGQTVLESAVLSVQEMGMVELPEGGCELHVLNTSLLAEGIVFACDAAEPLLPEILDRLPAELAAYCDSELGREPYLPRPNELCIAQFPNRGGRWCRAVMLAQVGGPGGALLSLMCQDHGEVDEVEARRVRKMLPEFARRPGLACMLTIKDFPTALSAEHEALALRLLAEVGLRALRCVRRDVGEYLVEAPEFVDALRAAL